MFLKIVCAWCGRFMGINAYTRAAQEGDLTAEESYKLERIGGMILSMVKA